MVQPQLAGIKVVDLTTVVFGPYCTQILADLGAEVIKIEKPGGEEGRKLGPPFSGADPAWFHQVNRNKKSVVIDIKDPQGHARLLRMMGAAEFVFGLNTNAKDPLCPESDFKVENGFVNVPKGPGLGITIDEKLLKANTLLQEKVG